MASELPVGIVGGGPVGLITALGLVRYGVPVVVFEEDGALSHDTKAGTTLTRTLEVLHRYGALDDVLRQSVRIDEIGEVDRATNAAKPGVEMGSLTEDTRFPFVVNVPQQAMEPALAGRLDALSPGALRHEHRLTAFREEGDHVEITLQTPTGERTERVSYLLGCDGGRSTVRRQLKIPAPGHTREERCALVDVKVDLDVSNPRDYPYLAYFADPDEWMILVRQPHCWRFVFPLAPGKPEPTVAELREKATHFIGAVDELEVLGSNVYSVHHRVADRYRAGRAFLLGDAAHLITPMWALGLNTGVLDASNLPWRLAWVLRGWADDTLLDGYETEQLPVALRGSGQMAQAAYEQMQKASAGGPVGAGTWGTAMTRGLLGVRLPVAEAGDVSIVRGGDAPRPLVAGDRLPDLPLFGDSGRTYLHDLAADSFVALYFTDTRRGPEIPPQHSPALRHYAVSRWDAPHDSGLRDRALFDPADRVRRRLGITGDTLVLLRPDGHAAAVADWDAREQGVPLAVKLYRDVTGRYPVD
ncbi:FAD-dependent monooxygenase [Nocardia sp. KC 131]|uniref:FAD-dependent monooxygenase n=1 Tax=Nocardia arseniciresistens TaxID=3392119 RepID=UPI00398F6E32